LLPYEKTPQYQRPAATLPRSKGHHRDWLDACKGGLRQQQLRVRRSADRVGIAWRPIAPRGQEDRLDAANLKASNVPEADAFIKETYRPDGNSREEDGPMTSRRQSLLHPRDEILQIMQRIYRYRMTRLPAAIYPFATRTETSGLRRPEWTKAVCGARTSSACTRMAARTACTDRPRNFPFIEHLRRASRHGRHCARPQCAWLRSAFRPACRTRVYFTRLVPSAACRGLLPTPCREARLWRTVSCALSAAGPHCAVLENHG